MKQDDVHFIDLIAASLNNFIIQKKDNINSSGCIEAAAPAKNNNNNCVVTTDADLNGLKSVLLELLKYAAVVKEVKCEGDYQQKSHQSENGRNNNLGGGGESEGGGGEFLNGSSNNNDGNNNNSKNCHADDKLTQNERVLTSLVAGAIAGGVAKTTIAPLDRTKIFFQTTPSTTFNIRNVLKYLYNTYKTTGFTSLWRGNSATMARIIPYAAIQFTAHEQWKWVLGAERKNSPEIIRFICGSLAGITAQSLTYPLDLTRARLAVSPVSKYSSLLDVFVKTVKGEGVRGLFKGFVPTMLGVIPYAGCSFYCYEGLKRVWVKEFGEGSIGGIERLCFGAFAGVVGQSSSYPFDIVRRRLQTGVVHDNGGRKAGVFNLMVHIARTEGVVGGLYKGLSMNWVKGPVAAGISFACYDSTQAFLREKLIVADKVDGGGDGKRRVAM